MEKERERASERASESMCTYIHTCIHTLRHIHTHTHIKRLQQQQQKQQQTINAPAARVCAARAAFSHSTRAWLFLNCSNWLFSMLARVQGSGFRD